MAAWIINLLIPCAMRANPENLRPAGMTYASNGEPYSGTVQIIPGISLFVLA